MRRLLKHLFYVILFPLFVLFTAASCKNKKHAVKHPPQVVTNTDTSGEHCHMDFKNGKALSKRMHDSEFYFTYASAKFNCQLTVDSEENSFNVSVRCRKDSVIWLSISKLGIDAARILITKDTVKFTLGLTEKKYFIGDFSYINEMLHSDLDYDMIQALLFGNSASFYDEDEKLKPGRDKTNCHYFLSTERKRRVKRITSGEENPHHTYQTIWMNPASFKITMLNFVDPQSNRKFNATYDNFKPVENYIAPFKLLYTITAEKNITADINYARISINEPLKFPFNIPSSYERIEFTK